MAGDLTLNTEQLESMNKSLSRMGRTLSREERALLTGIFGLGTQAIKDKLGKRAVANVKIDLGKSDRIPSLAQAFEDAFHVGKLASLPGDTVERVSVGVGVSVSGGGPGVGISVSTPI